jgi:inner membrane protein
MDSVTQIALGAGVAEAVLGRKVGNKAALIGAICGTLPDLDSFIPYADAVATVTYHRSFSHSLLVLTAMSPLLAWVVQRCMRQSPASFLQWWWLVFLVLITHPLLDGFTVYGTQLLWPLVDHAYSGSTIFIIDPAYTLPLGIGVILALRLAREDRRRWTANLTGLVLSSAYLLWSVVAKFQMEAIIRMQLDEQGIAHGGVLSTPGPFSTILWRFVVMAEGGYYEAYYSVLDAPHRVDFVFHADQKELLEPLRDHWPVQRLDWFTQGFYSAHLQGEQLVLSDLRMGVEGAYTFNYHVADRVDEQLQPVTSTQIEPPFRGAELGDILRRTVTPVR